MANSHTLGEAGLDLPPPTLRIIYNHLPTIPPLSIQLSKQCTCKYFPKYMHSINTSPYNSQKYITVCTNPPVLNSTNTSPYCSPNDVHLSTFQHTPTPSHCSPTESWSELKGTATHQRERCPTHRPPPSTTKALIIVLDCICIFHVLL